MASLVGTVTSELASLIEGSLAVCRCNGKSFKVARNAQHLLASVVLFPNFLHYGPFYIERLLFVLQIPDVAGQPGVVTVLGIIERSLV